MSELCPAYAFLFIASSDLHQVVGSLEVKFNQYAGSFETVKQLWDERQGLLVMNGNLVQGPVINTEAETFILLLDKEDRGSRK